MSDLPRYLPLSNGPRRDESDVSTSWNPQLADVLTALAAALDARPAQAWATTTGRPQWTVHHVMAHLVWRLSTPKGERWRATARAFARHGFKRASAEFELARTASVSVSPEVLLDSLVRLRDAALVGDGTVDTGIAALAEAVVAAADLGSSLATTIPVPERASGAVALRRALEAPTEIKAVVRGHTIAATDAGWSFGHGPELRGTAAEILLFLYERGGAAPRPAA